MRQFLEQGLAASTRKVYKAGWNRYIAFGGSFNIPPSPLTTEKVTLFVAYLGSEGLSVSTIQSYMAALRHFQILADPGNCSPSFYSPHMTILLRGIKRCQSLQGPKTVRLPITASVMHRIKSVLAQNGSSYYSILIWAACCMRFLDFSDAESSWSQMEAILTPTPTCPYRHLSRHIGQKLEIYTQSKSQKLFNFETGRKWFLETLTWTYVLLQLS